MIMWNLARYLECYVPLDLIFTILWGAQRIVECERHSLYPFYHSLSFIHGRFSLPDTSLRIRLVSPGSPCLRLVTYSLWQHVWARSLSSSFCHRCQGIECHFVHRIPCCSKPGRCYHCTQVCPSTFPYSSGVVPQEATDDYTCLGIESRFWSRLLHFSCTWYLASEFKRLVPHSGIVGKTSLEWISPDSSPGGIPFYSCFRWPECC